MERAYLISNLWNWLPAFRTVAETEHLPTAAKVLHVSASAISRSVKQLEREVGHALFDRNGGRMKLNCAGTQLLTAVRDAMRRVDDGLVQGAASRTSCIQLAGPPAWLQLLVLPALRMLTAGDRRVTLEISAGLPTDGERALLRGEVDLIVSDQVVDSAHIEVAHLGAIAHALCGQRGRSPRDRALPFGVWTGGTDVWPPQGERDVVLRTPDLALLIEACASGQVQAVLPFAIAVAHGLDIRPTPPLPSAQLYLARRRPLTESIVDALVDDIRQRAASVLAEPTLRALA